MDDIDLANAPKRYICEQCGVPMTRTLDGYRAITGSNSWRDTWDVVDPIWCSPTMEHSPIRIGIYA